MMMHSLDPQLLERPIRILVVGCGGNGSAIVSGLPYLHQAMLAFGHPGGLQVTLIDPDTVSETNCVRQPFCRTEIGFPKAIVLAHRINLFWGLNWQGMQATIQQLAKKGSEVDFVIGCVDTRKARRAIDKWVLEFAGTVLAGSRQQRIQRPVRSRAAEELGKQKKKHRLPTVTELFPEIAAPDKKDDDQPSCSAAEALTRQEPFINQNLAYQALGMLTQLLRHGSVSYQGGFCNLVDRAACAHTDSRGCGGSCSGAAVQKPLCQRDWLTRATLCLDQHVHWVRAAIPEIQADAAVWHLGDGRRNRAGRQVPSFGQNNGVARTSQAAVEYQFVALQSVTGRRGVRF